MSPPVQGGPHPAQQRRDSAVPDERIMVQQYTATGVTDTEGNHLMPITPTTIVGNAGLLAGSGTAALAQPAIARLGERRRACEILNRRTHQRGVPTGADRMVVVNCFSATVRSIPPTATRRAFQQSRLTTDGQPTDGDPVEQRT